MRILFGVFDWGLGHATRDLPLLERLLRDGHEVHIVSTGRALALLKDRLGGRCTFFDVPSLGNPYTRTRFFQVGFALHVPVMMRNLRRARRRVEELLLETAYDRVISDCRYDVYDRPENSYFINHQVRFASFWFGELVTEAWLASRQKHYGKILVPDFDRNNLSGKLSHNLRYVPRKKLVYLGILSFLRKRPLRKDVDCFISVSGPEPQRTEFERIVLSQLETLHGRVVVALGKPELRKTTLRRTKLADITIHGFLDRDKQEEMMNRARFIVTRSGYTTMMEMAELGVRHGLLIPTPGQTEQVYLAQLYADNEWYHTASQYGLDLRSEMVKAKGLRGFPKQWTTKESVEKFIKAVKL